MPAASPAPDNAATPAQPAEREHPPLWRYVDTARSHEVHAGLRRGPPLVFYIREFVPGGPPEETHEVAFLLRNVNDSRTHHAALESRLAYLGRYFRLNVGTTGWTPVRQVASVRPFDLGELDVDPTLGDIRVHHYGARESKRTVLLLGMPQPTPGGRRFVLARFAFTWPHAEMGELDVIHRRLPPRVYRSVLARLHFEMEQAGLERTPHLDYQSAAGAAWARELHAAVGTLLSRVTRDTGARPEPLRGPRAQRRAERTGPAAPTYEGGPAPRDLSDEASQPPEVLEALARRGPAYDIEDALPAAAPRESKKTATIEEVTTDYATVLRDPRILALHTKFLQAGEEARLYEGGELAIHQAIRQKRDAAPADARHLVSVLEASLLVRYAMMRRTKIDPVMGDLLRRALVYLV